MPSTKPMPIPSFCPVSRWTRASAQPATCRTWQPVTRCCWLPPSSHLDLVCGNLAPHIGASVPVCVCTKGIHLETGRLMTELAAHALDRAAVCGLSGPSFAAEVAAGLPTAVTVAGTQGDVEAISQCLSGPMFRIYRSDDVVGIEIGGALKNVIAIACGIAMGARSGRTAPAPRFVISRGYWPKWLRLAVEVLGAKPARDPDPACRAWATWR